jgi:hypothetical protein
LSSAPVFQLANLGFDAFDLSITLGVSSSSHSGWRDVDAGQDEGLVGRPGRPLRTMAAPTD